MSGSKQTGNLSLYDTAEVGDLFVLKRASYSVVTHSSGWSSNYTWIPAGQRIRLITKIVKNYEHDRVSIFELVGPKIVASRTTRIYWDSIGELSALEQLANAVCPSKSD